MTNTYVDKSYAYAVSRLRNAELGLLDDGFMDQLINAKSADAALALLKSRGWGSGDDGPDGDIFDRETENLWNFIDELVPDLSVFDVFRLESDFNNLKAAIKSSVLKADVPGIYEKNGTADPLEIREKIESRGYSELPEHLRKAAEEAHDIFLRTGDGQLCDITVDKACMEAFIDFAGKSGCAFLKDYAELKVASADIKIALRAAHTGKDRAFLDMSLADCGILYKDGLISAALNGEESIIAFLEYTDFSEAAKEIRKSLSAFEKSCDDLITDRMVSMRYEAFGLGPIAAYIIARENEIKSVRIILSGLENGFSPEFIKERVRDTYV